MSKREHRVIQLEASAFPDTDDAGAAKSAAVADSYHIKLAKQVRNLYILCRREFTGDHNYGKKGLGKWDGDDQFGTEVHSIWRRATKHIVLLSADPTAFLRAQFHYARPEYPPMPNQLMSDSAVDKYHRFVKNAEQDLKDRLSREMLSIRVEVNGLEGIGWVYPRALQYALFNVSVVIASPVLRYALALEFDLQKVASTFRERAVLQYAFQKKLYDRAWVGCIPAQLNMEGQNLVERVLM